MIQVMRRRGATRIELQTPSLRHVSQTAPYLFDGSLPTLEAVIDHYQQGSAVDLPGFSLTVEQRQSLLAFLRTL